MNSSAWEKFQGATLLLVRSGSLKDRITDAYRHHLSRVDETELPKELRDDFRSIHRALTRRPAAVFGDDSLRATIRKLSKREAEEIATNVVQMFSALQRSQAAPARPQLVAVPRKKVAEGF